MFSYGSDENQDSEEDGEAGGEGKGDGDDDRMDEDKVPPMQSDPNDLSAYNLDDYDNEAADTGMAVSRFLESILMGVKRLDLLVILKASHTTDRMKKTRISP